MVLCFEVYIWNNLVNINITLVFFIYGLAFFSMGLALFLESGRISSLLESRSWLPLAAFGLIHGSHEWLEMFLDKSEWLVVRYPIQIVWLRLGLLALSFVCLIIFGLARLRPQHRVPFNQMIGWWIAVGIYTILVVFWGLTYRVSHADWPSHIDASLRYLLAVPGAGLAGAALSRQATAVRSQGQRGMSTSLYWASWGFMIYALTQAVVPPLDIFPANLLNTVTFTQLVGFPIQVVRAAMAILITVALIKFIQLVELEHQQQFLAAQQARLEALDQVRRELVERESLRKRLIRHIVTAQEEERARIAREIHDETSQVLTAFSLHLAALRERLVENPQAVEQISHLQELSRRMSQGLYGLVHDLRPSQLDDLGLIPAFRYLCGELQKRYDLEVRLDIEGQVERMPSLVETALYRVAQEALTNVVRHSRVKEAVMRLVFSPDSVTLRITDQGRGFDPERKLTPPHGWGLAGMRERAESVSGQLNLTSSPGQGTMVEMIVPATSLDNLSEAVSDEMSDNKI